MLTHFKLWWYEVWMKPNVLMLRAGDAIATGDGIRFPPISGAQSGPYRRVEVRDDDGQLLMWQDFTQDVETPPEGFTIFAGN